MANRELAASDSTSLLGKAAPITLLGKTLERDEQGWHYIMTFPVVLEDKAKEYREEKMTKCIEQARQCYTTGKEGGWSLVADMFKDDMNKFEYFETHRKAVVKILAGPQAGYTLDTMKSIDGDELFLKIKLDNNELVGMILDRMDMPMHISPSLYTIDKIKAPDFTELQSEFKDPKNMCPTIQMSGGVFSGDDHCSAYTAFTMVKKGKNFFDDFTDDMYVHAARRRLEELIKPQVLIDQEVLGQYFPVHQWDQVLALHEVGFTQLRFMSYEGQNLLFRYMGCEVAYFFHWFTFYTIALTPLAVGAAVIRILRNYHVVNAQFYHEITCAYAILVIVWCAFWGAYYNRSAEVCHEKWGTRMRLEAAKPLNTFNVKYRGTTMETLQNAFHWFLVVLFLAETGYVTGYISGLRRSMEEDGDSSLFGLDHETSMTVAKTLVTVNIKVVAAIWQILSPWLTQRENHRTAAEQKDSRVIKLFIVKAVVYYYPFMYIAFMQKHIEGCDGPCISLLQENLAIFFVTQLATMFGTVAFTIVMTRFQIWWELRKATKKVNDALQYTYLQLQAKCPVYEEDTDDLMEIVLALGFLIMFSVALPSMVCIAFVANFLELKLLAFRMLYVNKRARRRVQFGIGVWTVIIRILSVIGVLTNGAIACFVYNDTPIQTLPMWKRMLTFIVLQNIIIVVRVIIEVAISPVTPAIVRAREINDIVLDELTGDVAVKYEAPSTTCPEMPLV
eukprot:TRINITY_DN393_c0_g1_i1.p1 TRINITY_DN393_c0_g1~~TRINITY_DN393_c0_g1_i1.p1  ORF type:complete len:760 (+),score=181.13 TRINITY_DN393_c0_g1_i1:92-2281(+)